VKVWRAFVDSFNCMPIAALIEKRVFCSHGGLSPRICTLEDINVICRPLEVPDYGLVADLLWSDPDESTRGWAPSQRGVSYVYGHDIVKSFNERFELDLICRAHQVNIYLLQYSRKYKGSNLHAHCDFLLLGCGRWVQIRMQQTAGYHFLRAKLLRLFR